MSQNIATEIKEMSCFSSDLLWRKELLVAHKSEMNAIIYAKFPLTIWHMHAFHIECDL